MAQLCFTLAICVFIPPERAFCWRNNHTAQIFADIVTANLIACYCCATRIGVDQTKTKSSTGGRFA
jgi:hypothetical protein